MSPARLLKSVMQNNIDDIMKFNKDIGQDNAGHIARMFNERFGDARITKEAFEGIQKNIDDFKLDPTTAKQSELFRGVTGGSQYKGNFVTQAFNTDGGSGFGGLFMGAGLGGLGAAATGGDAREGAVFGGIAGFGAAAAGRAIMKNVGSIEENFMNSLLKNKTISRGGVEIGPESIEEVAKRMDVSVDELTAKHLQDAGYGNVTHKQLFGKDFEDVVDMDAAVKQGYGDTRIGNKIVENFQFPGMKTPGTETPAMQALATRSERINYISNEQLLTNQDIKKAGFGAGFKKDVLTGTKDLNVAQYTRMTGAVGSALVGMGFSAKRRDHRRGFNSKRGNRV